MATETAETTIVTPPETAAQVEARPQPYRLTVEMYERIAAAGVFPDKTPIYLWRGQLVQKMTKGRRHNIASAELNAALLQIVPRGWFVRPEQPITIADDGMPEPDFTVVRGRSRDYGDRDVFAKDVSLVVEVADSSLAVDSGVMVEDFAREAIPVYWVLNVPGRTIDVYTEPTGAREAGPPYYAQRRSYRPEEEVPVVLDGREVGRIAVRDVLP